MVNSPRCPTMAPHDTGTWTFRRFRGQVASDIARVAGHDPDGVKRNAQVRATQGNPQVNFFVSTDLLVIYW